MGSGKSREKQEEEMKKKYFLVIRFLIATTLLASSISWATAQPLSFKTKSGSTILINKAKHKIQLKPQRGSIKDLDSPSYGNNDVWIDASYQKIQSREIIELKLWGTARGTSELVRPLWWVIYEIKGNDVNEVFSTNIDSVESAATPKSKGPPTKIVIKNGKLDFLVDGQSVVDDS